LHVPAAVRRWKSRIVIFISTLHKSTLYFSESYSSSHSLLKSKFIEYKME
jgi:hypothetical protein